MNTTIPSARPGRRTEVDALRGIALLGICVVNVPFLAGIDMFAVSENSMDRTAEFIVALLFQGKFFVLFAFLFGWGFSVQLRAAEHHGRNFKAEYVRRLLALAVFGLAHALLVFVGDILVLYALLGLLLLPLRQLTPRQLMAVAITLVGVTSLGLGVLAILLGEPLAEDSPVLSGYLGGFNDALAQRAFEYPFALGFILLFNGPPSLAAFCAGLAAAKVNIFAPGNRAFEAIKRSWRPLLVLAVVFNTAYALVIIGALGDGFVALFGFMGLAIGGPALGTLYLLATVQLARRGMFKGASASGRMSLTAYIGEGVLAGLLFNGYGFALYGQLGSLACLGVAVAIYVIVHVFCYLWLQFQRRGPLEVLLRLATRGTARSENWG